VQHPRLTRRQFLTGTAAGGLGALVGFSQPAAAGRIPSAVHIVAHADDALLFLNPDQQKDIAAGYVTRIVCLTAGESIFTDPAYWQGREAGMLASIASLAGVADSWTSSTLTVNGIPLLCQQLTAMPSVSMEFFRLPDGNVNGSGFVASSYQSLQSLWSGTITTMDAIDGSASYDKAALIATLAALLSAAQPVRIRTQDFVNTFGDGDHSDHYAVGQFVKAANAAYTGARRTLFGYLGYPSDQQPANVTRKYLTQKQAAWLAYAPDDPVVPQTIAAADKGPYGMWLARQYLAGQLATG
jgi:LmbE family N-acetylglucosaminyl deacetylase